MSDYESSEPTFEEVPSGVQPVAEPAAAPGGAVVLGDRTDLHIGDYVGFERISPNKDWKLSLGKVVAFPSTRTVKVAYYDAVNETTVAQDPVSEAAVRQAAESEDKMDIWHNREALREDLAQATAKEKASTQRLFTARDVTVVRQMAAGERVTASLEALDVARRSLRAIPSKQWRELRDPGHPSAEVMGVMRSVMLILYEDSVTAWEDIQEVMRRPDFMDRVASWDCTVTPMSLSRRKKIAALCAGEDEEALKSTKKRRRSGSRTPATAAAAAPSIAAQSSKFGTLGTLDKNMRAWISAQFVCSEAAREQEIVVNDCFADQQEQRVLLREINDMRVGISSIEVQMLEMKNAILGIEDAPKAIMPLDAYPTDTIFYKRTYPDTEGRFVQEIILRDSIIINFGPMAEEDAEGYVRLNATQVECLRTAVISSNVRHDAEEMEELLARKEREEQEMAELRARIQELRNKASLTAEEEEELAQLERLYADAERRHHATLSRIADLYACGRGAREITLAIRRPEFRYTRLHCKMSGDWEMILNDAGRHSEMLAAFCDDVSNMLNIPASYVLDIDARSGSLLIDFTVKHNGDLDDDELQDLINKGQFSALSMFYEKVTFKKTSPLNTSQQQEAYDLEQRLGAAAPISGMGMRQTLADYYNADGTLDEDFSDEVKAHPNYRVAVITIPPVREDYDEAAVRGAVEQHVEDDFEAPDAAVAASAMASSAETYQFQEEGESPGATHASAGLTDTAEAARDAETETAPATQVRSRTVDHAGAEQPPATEAAPAAAPPSSSSSSSSSTAPSKAAPAQPSPKADVAATPEEAAAAAAEPVPVASSSAAAAAAAAAEEEAGAGAEAEAAVHASTKASSAVTSSTPKSATSHKSSKRPTPKETYAAEL
ncbi:hypothetical protein NESM_000350700 [Novymonas esmeraldas]|uniref:Flagellar attachment zone protein 1 conserved domain-containing protein n=1 Tax=Novymonas esmeraldas TaxID=1808958 RepID=A0AAW0EMG3_9TRYP